MTRSPDLLAGLSEEESQRLMAAGLHLSLPSGAELFSLGSPAESLFIVERGRIKLTLPIQIRGKQQDIIVEEVQPWQTVGWSALIPPHCFTLKATALMDSEMICFRRDVLMAHFEANPLVGYTVSMNLAVLIGHRLQLFQAMWLREMQRIVELQYA